MIFIQLYVATAVLTAIVFFPAMVSLVQAEEGPISSVLSWVVCAALWPAAYWRIHRKIAERNQ